MNNIIKKLLILLSLNLLIQIPVLSQITLDSIEAKTTCLIFAEHQKLSEENPLLKSQILALEELNRISIEEDSIRKIEISELRDKIISDDKTIKKLKSANKKMIVKSSIGGAVLFILGLIL